MTAKSVSRQVWAANVPALNPGSGGSGSIPTLLVMVVVICVGGGVRSRPNRSPALITSVMKPVAMTPAIAPPRYRFMQTASRVVLSKHIDNVSFRA
jgi:hypothetical protein